MAPLTEAAVLVVEGDVLVVGVVAVLGLVEAAAGEHQVLELFGGDQAAVEGLRQDAAVVGLEDRQLGDQRADFQFGGGDLHFAGQAQLGILVGGAAIVVGGQQASAGAVGAGVELDAEHAQRIHAKADGAIGVARLQVEHEALGPIRRAWIAGRWCRRESRG